MSGVLSEVDQSSATSQQLWRRLLQEQLHAASLRMSDLADVWLVKAAVHLMAACDVPDSVAADLVAGTRSRLDRPPLEPPSVRAFVRRLDESRTAVVFAAMAAEAYLDRYIAVCGPGYRHMLERLPASDRFALAAELFSGPGSLRPAGSLQTGIAELLSLRDELARAKPLEAGPADTFREMFERVNPRVARRMVEVSAQACEAVSERCRPLTLTASTSALEVTKLLAERADAASVPPAFTDEALEDAARRPVERFPEDVIGD